METMTLNVEATMDETRRLGAPSEGGVTGTPVVVEGYDYVKVGEVLYRPCFRCDGRGFMEEYRGVMEEYRGVMEEYRGVMAGRCFRCAGRGWDGAENEADTRRKAKRRAADRARRERKATEEQAAKQAALVEWAEEFPDVAELARKVLREAVEQGVAYPAFVLDIARQTSFRPLSEKQMDAFAHAVERHWGEQMERDALLATKSHWGQEKDKVVGAPAQIVTRVVLDGDYGARLLLVAEGLDVLDGVTFKTIGTGESLWSHEVGARVLVTGTVKGHETYEDVPQTVLTRAKMVAMSS